MAKQSSLLYALVKYHCIDRQKYFTVFCMQTGLVYIFDKYEGFNSSKLYMKV